MEYLERTAAAVGRGLRGAVASCAGAFVSGASGSNVCPAGSVRIETEAACQTAAMSTGKNENVFVLDESLGASASPKGCSYVGNYTLFNPHAVGAGERYSQLLCATGAPRICAGCVCVCV